MALDHAEQGRAARRLIRGAAHAALATSFDGGPYVSLVAVACDMRAAPLLLLSDLAQHTRNIGADPRVSLLYGDVEGLADPLAGPRLTLLGRAERLDDPQAGARFSAHHPSSSAYAGFADFHLYRVSVERGHLVAGFGRISWLDAPHLAYAEDASALAGAEAEIVEHMNGEHAETVGLYAERLLRREGNGWRMTGIDPEGCDFRRGGETARLEFAAPVLTPEAARLALLALAQRARQAVPGR